jgi:hypothetical protein
MGIKPAPRQYHWMVIFAFLVACGKQAAVAPETPVPTTVLPTSTPATIFIPAIIPPSPLPTEPTIPVLTPDAIQVERWREYQTELAKLVLAQHSSQEIPFDETALCEWDILGRSDQEVYVWAMCSTPDSGRTKPAVIHLGLNGSIQKVEVPFHGSAWESTIQKLFPADLKEKIDAYFYSLSSNSGRAEELRMHLLNRSTHPDVPPLTILAAMPTPTPIP